jgi:hypothetical protein
LVESEETAAAIGKGVIVVICVVPMLQCSEVEMHARDKSIAGVVAGWELQ